MSEDSYQYSASHIKKTRWGDFFVLDNGEWETVWEIGFASPIPASPVVIHRDSAAGFTSTLYPNTAQSAKLHVVTREHAMAPEYYPLTFMTFAILNDEVGRGATIQGLPRAWCARFRARGDSGGS